MRESDLDSNPVYTGRKLNVHKMFRRRPGRLMYVQFASCVYGELELERSLGYIAIFQQSGFLCKSYKRLMYILKSSFI